MSDVSLISDSLPNLAVFYYYYTFITLILCWCIAPILFYVIFTKSKNLGKFKWLIFNYSFWSLCFTSLIGLVKPLFLAPAAAGFQIGIFGDFGDYRNTVVAVILCLIFCGNCYIGLSLTLAYRYLIVFPSPLKKWFTLKNVFLLTILLPSILYLLIIFVFLHLTEMTNDTIRIWAKNYDENFEIYFSEKTLIFAPHSSIDIATKVALFSFSLGLLLFVFILLFLRYQMKKHKSKMISKTSKSLILSSSVQIFLASILFLIPCGIFMAVLTFQIQNTTSLIIVLFCFASSHCFFDFVASLYFITPYRNYLINFFKSKTPRRKSISTVIPGTIKHQIN